MPPTRPSPRLATLKRLAWLALGVGTLLRAAAALAAESLAHRRGELDLFPDASIYWQLSRALRAGAPFAVNQWGVLHYALRTPGYPLFLAAFPTTLPARIAQAALGGLGAWMVGKLAGATRLGPEVAATATILAALDPWSAGLSAVLLSEAVFTPLMLASLWGLATLGNPDNRRRATLLALATGAASGLAILVKPSWALFPPAACVAYLAATPRVLRPQALRHAATLALGLALAMAPWWARNAHHYERFVPTALWLGASLYDGWNPQANGASNMDFLNAPDVRTLGETEQDSLLRDRALQWAATHPAATLKLAAIKAARFASPWPNADSFRNPRVAAILAAWTIPVFALMAWGTWNRRRDLLSLTLLAGPLLYFGLVHLAFASSVRYRIPAALPALALAALAAQRLIPRPSLAAHSPGRSPPS